MNLFVKIMGSCVILAGVIQLIITPDMSYRWLAMAAIILWGGVFLTTPSKNKNKNKY